MNFFNIRYQSFQVSMSVIQHGSVLQATFYHQYSSMSLKHTLQFYSLHIATTYPSTIKIQHYLLDLSGVTWLLHHFIFSRMIYQISIRTQRFDFSLSLSQDIAALIFQKRLVSIGKNDSDENITNKFFLSKYKKKSIED